MLCGRKFALVQAGIEGKRMSEQTHNSQQTLVIGLAIVAALLAGIIGVLIYQQNTAVPAPTVSEQPATTPAASGGTAGQSAGEAAAFDPKQATQVPKGTEPEAYVKAYYQACQDGEWKKAFDMLPADKKVGNSPDALKEQVSGYGIKSFKMAGATAQGDKASVKAEQVTGQYGTFENTWTFVKGDNGAWLVQSKAVTGMK